MSPEWPRVALGTVLTRRKDEITVQELDTYDRLTIRMNGGGIRLRDRLPGSEIGTKNQFLVRKEQLLLSKIDARNGAFGIVPDECDGAIITGNFWAFDIDHKRLDPRFFDYLTKTRLFIDFCIRGSEGTTNRLYLQEPLFLAQLISLPPLAEQRRIVARIEELAAKIAEARGLRREAVEEAEALKQSYAEREYAEAITSVGATSLEAASTTI
jgi:type I restriction enzyme, S subunit